MMTASGHVDTARGLCVFVRQRVCMHQVLIISHKPRVESWQGVMQRAGVFLIAMRLHRIF